MQFRTVALGASALALLGASAIEPRFLSAQSAAATPVLSADSTAGIGACAALASLKLDTVTILSARIQSAGGPLDDNAASPGMPPLKTMPEFCRVVGRIVPEAGSSIAFEVWMPSSGWNGRLHGAGMGGFAGSIDTTALSMAVKGGEVGISTDTGHHGSMMDTAWAKGSPGRVRDYGWRAIHVSTVAAKTLVKAFYGTGPKHSYFVGCSGGGRQGLIEASRFPEDYDGVVAGAPAAKWTDLAFAMINTVKAQQAPGAAIRASQLPLIQSEVVAQCDAKDGQIDGLVDDPRQCRFDPSRLACGTSKSAQCLAPPQLSALRQIYAGPHDSAGHRLAAGYLAGGAEVGVPVAAFGWESYILNRADGHSGSEKHMAGLLGDLVQHPFATPENFDFDKDPVKLRAALSSDLDASPNLGRFFARGGKVILWHGWADPAIPPEATIAYRDAALRQSGARARQSMRLFMVPGLQHCMGGTGPGSFGQLHPPQLGETPTRHVVAALQHWVEDGPAPETLVASRGFGGLMGMPFSTPDRQRLLCAYPKRSALKPGSDPDQATSYTCH